MRNARRTGIGRDYLDGVPEQLVVRGLRAWMLGLEFNDVACLVGAAEFYEEKLGPRPGAACSGLMGRWIGRLWRDTPRKLGFQPPCCRFMTHDECMAAGIISALQHDDADTALLANGFLLGRSGPADPDAHLGPAADAALALAECGQMLIRVPASVLERIALQHNDPRATRH